MADKVEAVGIVWIAPEVIATERRAQTVKRHRGDADALIAKLDELERTVTGEYRRIKDPDNGGDTSLGSATRVENNVLVEEYEDDLLVFISTNDDPVEAGGHYEIYDPAKHGEPYAPIPSRRGAPIVEPPRQGDER